MNNFSPRSGNLFQPNGNALGKENHLNLLRSRILFGGRGFCDAMQGFVEWELIVNLRVN